MPVVADDLNAFQSDDVLAVTKPAAGTSWYLTVIVASGPVTAWFTTEDARDEFYKRLIDAMQKG